MLLCFWGTSILCYLW